MDWYMNRRMHVSEEEWEAGEKYRVPFEEKSNIVIKPEPKEDISKEEIDTLITYQESVIKECEKEIETTQIKIARISKDIQELKKFIDNEKEE